MSNYLIDHPLSPFVQQAGSLQNKNIKEIITEKQDFINLWAFVNIKGYFLDGNA